MEVVFELCGFPHFFECIVCEYFFGVHRSKQEHEPEESRAEYLSHFSICALRTCFSSQHGIIGADGFALSLHGVCTCWSCEPLLVVDHLVAKRCEVLKYHLRQMFDILEEKAKNSVDIGLQELEERQALKWLLSAEDAAALGGVVKGSSQSPLFSGFWSQARLHRIAHHIYLALLESVVASFAGKTLDGSLNGFFWRMLRSREFHVCDPRHVRTFFFFDCRVLQGDCPKSSSFTGPVTVR